MLNRFVTLLALLTLAAAPFASWGTPDQEAHKALAEHVAKLKALYASEVQVKFTNVAENQPTATGVFVVSKPVEGERAMRLPKSSADKAADANLPLPLDLAAKPEYGLPLGSSLEAQGAGVCGANECLVYRTKGDLNGKGKVFFDARIRVLKSNLKPFDSHVTLSGIPFVDAYIYTVTFSDSPQGIRIAESQEKLKGKLMFKAFEMERVQTFAAWQPR